VSACTDAPTTAGLLAAACESAGLAVPVGPADPDHWPNDLEVVRRTDRERRFVVLINHADSSAEITVGTSRVTVPAGEVMVIRDGNHSSLR
jgi:hypothetical protein